MVLRYLYKLSVRPIDENVVRSTSRLLNSIKTSENVCLYDPSPNLEFSEEYFSMSTAFQYFYIGEYFWNTKFNR